VSDWGIGFLSMKPSAFFDAFFTTKPQGTGMGTVHQSAVIERHGGRLWASPNAGRGAILQFTLPGEWTAAWPRQLDAGARKPSRTTHASHRRRPMPSATGNRLEHPAWINPEGAIGEVSA